MVHTSGVPENSFGSGTAIVPRVPYTSNSGTRLAHCSKLTNTVETAPFTCSTIAVTWVSTSTGNVAPASGPRAMLRRRSERVALPETRTTGPNRVTSDVR